DLQHPRAPVPRELCHPRDVKLFGVAEGIDLVEELPSARCSGAVDHAARPLVPITLDRTLRVFCRCRTHVLPAWGVPTLGRRLEPLDGVWSLWTVDRHWGAHSSAVQNGQQALQVTLSAEPLLERHPARPTHLLE